jgi:putative MATE family efflux protein
MKEVDTDQLLTGSIFRQLFKLATPMIIGFFFITSYNFIDRFFVSRLGDLAIAAIGMAFTVQLIMISLGSGIGVGVNSFISRNLGSKRENVSMDAALHTFVLALAIGIAFTILGLLLQKHLFEFLGAKGDLLKLIMNYLTIIFIFAPVTLLSMFSSGIFQGWGDTVSPMKFMMIGTVLNLTLDPLLIFGLGPFPELGISGAALASGIGRSVSLLYMLFVLFIRRRPAHLRISRFKFSWQIVKGILQVGFPSSLSQILTSVAMGCIFLILKPFGDNARAAYTIVFTYEVVIFLPTIGVSQAITILTGHNFGARLISRIKEIYHKGIMVSFSMMTFTSVIILISPRTFASVFAQSTEVLEISSVALRITAVGYLFVSAYFCSIASFQGLGMGRQYLIANIFRMFILQIPFAFIGGLLFNLTGVWIGMMTVNILSAFILYKWFFHLFNRRVVTGEIQPI